MPFQARRGVSFDNKLKLSLRLNLPIRVKLLIHPVGWLHNTRKLLS